MNSVLVCLPCYLLLLSCAGGSGENPEQEDREQPAVSNPAPGGTAAPGRPTVTQAAKLPSALPARTASKPVPLTQAELEQYRKDLPIAVPPRSATLQQGSPRTGVPTTVKLVGHGGVMIARRTVDGSTLQNCVDDAAGAIEFFESPTSVPLASEAQ